MPMPVVEIRHVRMVMVEGDMPMGMRMRFAQTAIVRMMMVRVVQVEMIVLHFLVRMQVAVALT